MAQDTAHLYAAALEAISDDKAKLDKCVIMLPISVLDPVLCDSTCTRASADSDTCCQRFHMNTVRACRRWFDRVITCQFDEVITS